MRSGHADGVGVAGDASQQFGSFHHFESVVAEVLEYRIGFRHGRSVDHKGFRRVPESGWNLCLVGLEGKERPFPLELIGELSYPATATP